MFIIARHEETWLLSTADSVISPQLYAVGEFDFDKLRTAMHILGHASLTTIIDVGAHIGSICIPAVKRGLFARAIAIEPDPVNFSLLNANLLINGVGDRVSVSNAPVGAIEGALFARRDGGHNSGDHRFTPAGTYADGVLHDENESIVLDSLYDSIEPGSALLWMDIQGAEGMALSGAERLLSLGIPVVVEFDPKLLEPNGGLSIGFEFLADFEGFVNLASPSHEVMPTGELSSLYAISLLSGSSFDLLFVPKPPGE